ncbi:MAG: hypothetical protein HYU64_18860 [Armatimonadetes bacterium]|nr:hypothetical protein [Armatimonadota bacterium]
MMRTIADKLRLLCFSWIILFFLAASGLPASTLPDLSVSIVTVPENPSPGQLVFVLATVRNVGDGDAAGFQARFFLDGQPVGSADYPTILPPGGIASLPLAGTMSWTAAPGRHELSVRINEDHQQNEASFSNNESRKLVAVGGSERTSPVATPVPAPVPAPVSTPPDRITKPQPDKTPVPAATQPTPPVSAPSPTPSTPSPAPTSAGPKPSVLSLPELVKGPVFLVTWSFGGSTGIEIEYREGPQGRWKKWLVRKEGESNSAQFVGIKGRTYYFRARGLGGQGNPEPREEGNGDTYTTVGKSDEIVPLSQGLSLSVPHKSALWEKAGGFPAVLHRLQSPFQAAGVNSETPAGTRATLPACSVTPLPATVETLLFSVSWSAGNSAKCEIQYKDTSSGDWKTWIVRKPGSGNQAAFFGLRGHTYLFRARGFDEMGNPGPWSGGEKGETQTTVILKSGPAPLAEKPVTPAPVLTAREKPPAQEKPIPSTPQPAPPKEKPAPLSPPTPISTSPSPSSGAPFSQVQPLPPEQKDLLFPVSWTAVNASKVEVQYKDRDTGIWKTWIVRKAGEPGVATFFGLRGHSYYFRSRAFDGAGQANPWPSNEYGDAFTVVLFGQSQLVARTEPPSPLTPPDATRPKTQDTPGASPSPAPALTPAPTPESAPATASTPAPKPAPANVTAPHTAPTPPPAPSSSSSAPAPVPTPPPEKTVGLGPGKPATGVDLQIRESDSIETPRQCKAGETLKVSTLLRNEGSLEARNVTVVFLADGKEFAKGVIDRVPPASVGALSAEWTATTPGPHKITIVADPTNQTEDVRKDNNEATIEVTVTGSPSARTAARSGAQGPSGNSSHSKNLSSRKGTSPPPRTTAKSDLSQAPLRAETIELRPEMKFDIMREMQKRKYADLSVREEDLRFSVGNPKANEPILITAIVTNSGRVPAREVAVSFIQDGVEFVREMLESIPGSSKIPISRRWQSATPGLHRITIIVDPEAKIPEADKENNIVTKDIVVAPEK